MYCTRQTFLGSDKSVSESEFYDVNMHFCMVTDIQVNNSNKENVSIAFLTNRENNQQKCIKWGRGLAKQDRCLRK